MGQTRPGKVITLSLQHLGCLVSRSRRALRREFESRLAKHDLTVPQVTVLMSLWDENDKTISELSRMVSSDGPTLTSLLDRLEARDLIERVRDPHDRRTIRIRLREGGRRLKTDVMHSADEVMELVQRGMTQKQVDELCCLLHQLCESVEGVRSANECVAASRS